MPNKAGQRFCDGFCRSAHKRFPLDEMPRSGMETLIVAFDVDGTLISNEELDKNNIVANERVRDLLIIMAHMKNVRVVVWSGGGELWAKQAVAALNIGKYVDEVRSKDNELKPDIAIDDIQECALGKMNLIVREK